MSAFPNLFLIKVLFVLDIVFIGNFVGLRVKPMSRKVFAVLGITYWRCISVFTDGCRLYSRSKLELESQLERNFAS